VTVEPAVEATFETVVVAGLAVVDTAELRPEAKAVAGATRHTSSDSKSAAAKRLRRIPTVLPRSSTGSKLHRPARNLPIPRRS
jgi:hypothetical protein